MKQRVSGWPLDRSSSWNYHSKRFGQEMFHFGQFCRSSAKMTPQHRIVIQGRPEFEALVGGLRSSLVAAPISPKGCRHSQSTGSSKTVKLTGQHSLWHQRLAALSASGAVAFSCDCSSRARSSSFFSLPSTAESPMCSSCRTPSASIV
jgi:hypothetical protein